MEHSFAGVVHTAGVLDDGVLESLTPERVDRVLAPKVDAAWHLHELASEHGVSQFVLFSSAAAVLGSRGSGELRGGERVSGCARGGAPGGWVACDRRWRGGCGRAGWRERRIDRARLERMGMPALSDEQGWRLFDTAVGGDDALVVPMGLDLSALRAQGELLPAVFRGLVPARARRERSAQAGVLAERLAAVEESERDRFVLELVRGEVAAVLGHSSPGSVEPERAFKELGFDSLSAVELRNRLSQVTGLRLPATLVFDHPSPVAVARFVREQVEGQVGGARGW